ncbi:TadE/TadG family type IV pilus assembly protein [Humibacter ginsengisoli]
MNSFGRNGDGKVSPRTTAAYRLRLALFENTTPPSKSEMGWCMSVRRRLTRLLRCESGAEAVEFALVIPVILLIVFGAIEFGRLYNEQIQLTGAARSAARVMAIDSSTVITGSELQSWAPALSPTLTASGNLALSYLDASGAAASACSTGGTVTATLNYAAPLLTRLWGPTMSLSAKAVMPCGG